MRCASVLVGLVSALACLSGCSGTQSIRVVDTPPIPSEAPNGKSLVVIHNPVKESDNQMPYIFRDESLVGALSEGTVCQVTCEPGDHYFHLMSRWWSMTRSLVKTSLAPGRVYDLVLDAKCEQRVWRCTLNPIKADAKEGGDRRAKVAEWLKTERPVKMDPADADLVRYIEYNYRKHSKRVVSDEPTDTLGPDDARR